LIINGKSFVGAATSPPNPGPDLATVAVALPLDVQGNLSLTHAAGEVVGPTEKNEHRTSNIEWIMGKDEETEDRCSLFGIGSLFSFEVGRSMFDVGRSVCKRNSAPLRHSRLINKVLFPK
jgi:hypothetical protein